MNKSLIIVILFFLSFNVQAQYKDWTDANIYFKDGTLLEGQARLMPHGVLRFIKEKKQRRTDKFTAEEVDSVLFDLDYKVKSRRVRRKATYIPILTFKKRKKTAFDFAELVIDGNIKLVKRTVVGDNNVNFGKVYKEILLIRENEVAVLMNYTGFESFKKMASEYFSDCASLVSKIESKRYRKKDLEYIVKFYNDNCAK